jgi:hypothetical protein
MNTVVECMLEYYRRKYPQLEATGSNEERLEKSDTHLVWLMLDDACPLCREVGYRYCKELKPGQCGCRYLDSCIHDWNHIASDVFDVSLVSKGYYWRSGVSPCPQFRTVITPQSYDPDHDAKVEFHKVARCYAILRMFYSVGLDEDAIPDDSSWFSEMLMSCGPWVNCCCAHITE